MDEYSMPSVGDSSTPLPYPILQSVVGAAAAAIEIVNATVVEVAAGGDLLQNVVGTTMRPPVIRDETPWSVSLLFLAVAVSIIIVGIAGNAFVVAVIFTDRKLLHSSVNLFLLNLALADMGNIIFCAPDVILTLLGLPWVLPDVLCPVLRFLQHYFLFASVLLQMSIGIERFMAICSPLQMQRFSRRTTVFFLFVAWLLAALIAAPTVVFSRAQPVPRFNNSNICAAHDFSGKIRSMVEIVHFAILYCIPLVLLTVLYFIMCRRLWGKECMIAGETQQMAILRLRRSVVKMLVISMLIYFICYTPIQSLGILHLKPPQWLRLSINLLVLLSSAANPIVYIMCCRHFHQRFVSMVNRTIRCCPRSPEKYQTVITDADKVREVSIDYRSESGIQYPTYARMSVVTHSSSSRRHRKVKQRERSADVSLSVRLLPQIDATRDEAAADALGDAAVGRSGRRERAGRVALRDRDRAASGDSSPPSLSASSPSTRGARASTASATSFHWAATRDSNKYRAFRCTNPKKSTEMISVDFS
ncbi:npr-33 [Pristionchus pacificus]|uniref:Npr-33 n=1 Tax=Pristionchus pacificus TaxID=54126 RepID=A0A2A6B586_PRIPA|nr:npr-33 [Pristionchus pacificus]|eukprot:PDM61039.1 npr-33 [Pristionchus pacificus]